jgi:hypothetical protein
MALSGTAVSKIIIGTSIAIYMLAVTQPCFDTSLSTGESGEGIAILITGLLGFFTSLSTLTWFANPALWLSWAYCIKKPKSSLRTSAVAVFIALLFLACKKIAVDEAGNTATIINYRIGYWLWLLSMLVMLAGNLYLKIKPNRNASIN